jgi:hypothetical protein
VNKKNAVRILVGKPEGKRPARRPRLRWVDNIKIDLRDMGWGGMDCIDLAQNMNQWRAIMKRWRSFGFHKFLPKNEPSKKPKRRAVFGLNSVTTEKTTFF